MLEAFSSNNCHQRADRVQLAGGDLSAHDLRRSFGQPAQVIRCSGYQIFDYAGTAGAAAIDAMVLTTLKTASLHHRF